MEEKLSVEEFVVRAIDKLRNPNYKGIHVVFSGFNEAFRKYFPDKDPKEELNRMAQAGKIVIRPVRRGVMIYKPGEAPTQANAGDVALGKMGLE